MSAQARQRRKKCEASARSPAQRIGMRGVPPVVITASLLLPACVGSGTPPAHGTSGGSAGSSGSSGSGGSGGSSGSGGSGGSSGSSGSGGSSGSSGSGGSGGSATGAFT